MDTKDAIRQFIRTNFLFGSTNHFDDDDSFMENGIIDSTGVLELVSFVEEKFDIEEIPEEEAEKIQTVGDAIEYIKDKTGQE